VVFSSLHPNSGTVNGTNYNYVLTTGNYQASSVSLSTKTMCINGNVILYFPNGLSISGQSFIYIAPGATLKAYLGGSSTLSGQGTVNGSGFAVNCSYIGLPSCISLQNSGSSDFIGTIYAPEAAVALSGGDSQLVNFAGAVVANTVSVSGSYQFHFDQALCGECQSPLVSGGPVNETNCPGTSATFTVNASGTGLTYQWYHGNSPLGGQTGSTLMLPSVSASDAGIYSVVVSGVCGLPATNSATLTVNSAMLGGGLTLAWADTEFSFSENVMISDPAHGITMRSGEHSGSGSHTDFLVGGYAGASLVYAISEKVRLLAGAMFQAAGTSINHQNGKESVLDLGKSVVISVGASYAF
jgi:hypothetical protein